MNILDIINATPEQKEAAPVTQEIPPPPAPAQPMGTSFDHLPPTEDIAAQTLRKLYQRSRTLLAQIATNMEKVGEKLLMDEGTRRLAERMGDEALAKLLAIEVAATKQVIEGKMSIVLTQKDELLEKKGEISEELEHLRGPGRFAKDASERELELIQQDAELTRQLGEAIQRLQACRPLTDAISRLGLGAGENTAHDENSTYRLSQLVEEMGEKQERVSALIAQLRQKGLLTRTGKRGIYTAQERHILLDVARSKSVSEISRDWGNAASTLKQTIESRLTEGTDYYNLGKGSERDAYRVTPTGLTKLKAALSLTRARQ